MSSLAPPRALFDADVLIKLSVIDCFQDCIAALGLQLPECATLLSMTKSAGISNATVRDRRSGGGKASRRLFRTLSAIPTIDKLAADEQALAAKLNQASQNAGVFVDGGEAILFSISIIRGIPVVTTGDKKAIKSLPPLKRAVPELAAMQKRVVPFERILLQLVSAKGFAGLLSRLEAGKACDGALRDSLQEAAGDQDKFCAALEGRLAVLAQSAAFFLAAN
jgi:hypothetical protein